MLIVLFAINSLDLISREHLVATQVYTRCFTTCGHYCRRWFSRSLWSKIHINMWPILDGYGVMAVWNLE